MARRYKYGYNLYNDYLTHLMLNGDDISDKKIGTNIYNVFSSIISYYLDDQNDLIYLDYKIVNNEGIFKILPLNFITALWLCDIFVDELEIVNESNHLEIEGVEYSYNKETFKLEINNI